MGPYWDRVRNGGRGGAELVAGWAASYFCGFQGGLWQRKRDLKDLQGAGRLEVTGGGGWPLRVADSTQTQGLETWALPTALSWAPSDLEERPTSERASSPVKWEKH